MWVVPNIFVKHRNATNFKTAVFLELDVSFSCLLEDFVVDKVSVPSKNKGVLYLSG